MSPQEFRGANQLTSVGSLLKPSFLFLHSTKYVTFQWTGTSQSPSSVLLTIIIFAIVKTSRCIPCVFHFQICQLNQSCSYSLLPFMAKVFLNCLQWFLLRDTTGSSSESSHHQDPTPTNIYKLIRNTTSSHYHDSVEQKERSCFGDILFPEP